MGFNPIDRYIRRRRESITADEVLKKLYSKNDSAANRVIAHHLGDPLHYDSTAFASDIRSAINLIELAIDEIIEGGVRNG